MRSVGSASEVDGITGSLKITAPAAVLWPLTRRCRPQASTVYAFRCEMAGVGGEDGRSNHLSAKQK